MAGLLKIHYAYYSDILSKIKLFLGRQPMMLHAIRVLGYSEEI